MEYNPYVGNDGNEGKALVLHTTAYYAKCLSVVDMFMAFMNIVTGLYPTMLLALCSYVGYAGAKYFDKTYVLAYTAYQVILLAGRILFFWYIAAKIDVVLVTYNVMSVSINAYIAFFFIRFYTLIPSRDSMYVERVSNI